MFPQKTVGIAYEMGWSTVHSKIYAEKYENTCYLNYVGQAGVGHIKISEEFFKAIVKEFNSEKRILTK